MGNPEGGTLGNPGDQTSGDPREAQGGGAACGGRRQPIIDPPTFSIFREIDSFVNVWVWDQFCSYSVIRTNLGAPYWPY